MKPGDGRLITRCASRSLQVREGEIVDFVLRSVPQEGFTKSAANKATEATKEMAEQLGVDLTTLARGVSKIRSDEDPILSAKLVEGLIAQTNDYWLKWISKCTYKGRWREAVQRQALTLKMLVYEETGAIIAAPTFSLPEHIGGTRSVCPFLPCLEGTFADDPSRCSRLGLQVHLDPRLLVRRHSSTLTRLSDASRP